MTETEQAANELAVEWAEKAGIENMRGRLETAGLLAKDSATTLNVLLAGVGGSLAYGVKLAEGATGPLLWGAVAVCLYLTVLSSVLVKRCLLLQAVFGVYNEPKHLNQPKFPLRDLRVVELERLQERIEGATIHNDRKAAWLNRVRRFSLGTPAVFVIAAGAAWLVLQNYV